VTVLALEGSEERPGGADLLPELRAADQGVEILSVASEPAKKADGTTLLRLRVLIGPGWKDPEHPPSLSVFFPSTGKTYLYGRPAASPPFGIDRTPSGGVATPRAIAPRSELELSASFDRSSAFVGEIVFIETVLEGPGSLAGAEAPRVEIVSGGEFSGLASRSLSLDAVSGIGRLESRRAVRTLRSGTLRALVEAKGIKSPGSGIELEIPILESGAPSLEALDPPEPGSSGPERSAKAAMPAWIVLAGIGFAALLCALALFLSRKGAFPRMRIAEISLAVLGALAIASALVVGSASPRARGFAATEGMRLYAAPDERSSSVPLDGTEGKGLIIGRTADAGKEWTLVRFADGTQGWLSSDRSAE
jgi:hypothetical protein